MRRRSKRLLPAPPRAGASGDPKPSIAARIGRRLPTRLRAGADDALAGRRLVFAAAGAVAGATAGGARGVVAPILLGGAGWRAAGFVQARTARERAEEVAGALPGAIDLLALCVLGGMGIEPALRMVASQTEGVLGEAFRAFTDALDVGLPREDAYDALARVAATTQAAAFVSSLRRAERYGVRLAGVLVAQATEARDMAKTKIRERAMGAPVRMLFPLTLCFLPAFVLIAIAPSLIVAFQSFKQW